MKQEIKVAQIKTEVIEIGAEEIISREAPKEEVKIDELKKEEPKIETRKIEAPKISFDEALRKFIVTKYPGSPIELPGYRDEINSFTVGTTSYTDLNTRSSGTDTYTGTSTNLTVDRDVSGGASAGDVAGSFTPTHTINFSTRTINQGITGSVKIGSVTTSRSFTTNKDYNYNIGTTGNVTPASSFSIDSSSNISNISSSITGDISKTVPSSGYEDSSTATLFMTVESRFNNQTNRSFADTVDTTVTVQTTDGSGTNKVSGSTSNGRD